MMRTQSIIRLMKGLTLVFLLLAAGASAAGQTTPKTGAKPAVQAKKAAPKKVVRRRPARRRGQAAPTRARILEIQSALAKHGSYQGIPSGRWDAATMEAMKKFQSSNGLNPSGKITALSLQKLGLGSEVAGFGAPRQSFSPSANLNSLNQDTVNKN